MPPPKDSGFLEFAEARLDLRIPFLGEGRGDEIEVAKADRPRLAPLLRAGAGRREVAVPDLELDVRRLDLLGIGHDRHGPGKLAMKGRRFACVDEGGDSRLRRIESSLEELESFGVDRDRAARLPFGESNGIKSLVEDDEASVPDGQADRDRHPLPVALVHELPDRPVQCGKRLSTAGTASRVHSAALHEWGDFGKRV